VRWGLGALVAVLLVLLFVRGCDEEAPTAAAPVCPPCDEGEGEAGTDTGAAAVAGGRIPPQPRPAYRNPAPPPIPWLADLRLQVAGRSDRLAACFVGAERPGALKWTASVQPEDGRVAEAEVQPMLGGESLTAAQRDCVQQVLAEPPYRLDHDGERSTPPRVSLVIEF